jgi:hypothetical protein
MKRSPKPRWKMCAFAALGFVGVFIVNSSACALVAGIGAPVLPDSGARDGGHETEGGRGNDASDASDAGRATSPDYPLLGTLNLGGQQTLYAGEAWQTWAGKFHVNIVSDYIGFEQDMGETMSAVFLSVKAHGKENGIAPKCLIDTSDEEVPFSRGANASNGSFLKLWDAVDANNWWLRATWPTGSIEPISSTVAQINNGDDTTTDGSGRTAMQFFSWYWNQIYILGNALSLCETKSVAPNPDCDGFFRESQFWTPRASGDWLENGTSETAAPVGGKGNATLNPVIQQGHAQAVVAMHAYNPSLLNMADGDWYSDMYSTIDMSCQRLYDAQLFGSAIGESDSVEESSGFDQLMTNMKASEPLVVSGGFSLLVQTNASGTNTWPQSLESWNASHYQGMRYGLCTALQRGYYYDAEAGTPATLWYFDEYNGGTVDEVGYLGPPVDPPQSISWQNGVWRRRYTNGAAYVNPKGNGTQTVALGVTQYHISGSQQPTINTGNSATSVTLQDRDGIVMLNDAPP